MRFADITGHSEQIRLLRKMVDEDRLPHAILLGGEPGLGKLCVAEATAQYIQCENPTHGDSCGKCASCLRHASQNNPDLMYSFPMITRKSEDKEVCDDCMDEWREFRRLYPLAEYENWMTVLNAGNSQPQIPVKEARELIRKMSMSNLSSKYKVVIVWLPEKMNESAANALLKLIEEPFADTKFIFVSNAPQLILPTIFSRLQRMTFNRIDPLLLAAGLEQNHHVDPDMAAELARLSEGNMAKALAMLNTDDERAEFDLMFKTLMRQAYARDIAGLKEWSEQAAGYGREKLRRMLSYVSAMVRENFVYNFHNADLNLQSREQAEFSRKFAPFIHGGNVVNIIEETDRAYADIGGNANSKLVMFDYAIRMILEIKRQ